MLKAIIVIDEQLASSVLEITHTYSDRLNIVGTYHRFATALPNIHRLRPDLIFLEITLMDSINYKDKLMETEEHYSTDVILFAKETSETIRVLELSAISYSKQQISAAKRVLIIEQSTTADQKKLLFHNLSMSDDQKIVLPLVNGSIEQHRLLSIKYIEGHGHGTKVYVEEKKALVDCRYPPKKLFQLLPPLLFFNIQDSIWVNRKFITQYLEAHGGYIIMKDKSTFSIAQSRKKLFDRWIDQ